MNSLQLHCAAVPPAVQAPGRLGSPPSTAATRRIQFDRRGRARDQVSAITKTSDIGKLVDGVNLRIGTPAYAGSLPCETSRRGVKTTSGFFCSPGNGA